MVGAFCAQMTIMPVVLEKARMCLGSWTNIKPVRGVRAGVCLCASQKLHGAVKAA